MGDKLTPRHCGCCESSVLGLALAAGAGCTSTSTQHQRAPLPADVQAITFLQRTPRNDDGNVFDYNNFVAGGRLSMLSPALGEREADGRLPEYGDLHADPQADGTPLPPATSTTA